MPARTRRPTVPRESFVDFLFPIQGVDISNPYGQQRPRTTPVANNVRAFEPGTNRARGGQRPGVNSYITGTVNGNFNIQCIAALTDTTGTGGGFGTQGTQTVVWTRTPQDALEIGNVNLSNSNSNVFSYASGGRCGSPVCCINTASQSTVFALAGATTGASVWEIIQTYPGKFIASGNVPGASIFNNPYVASVATDASKFFVVATADSAISIARITTAGAVDYTTTTTAIGANLSGGLAATCSYSVIASGILYTVWTTGYVTQLKTSDGTANTPLLLMTPTTLAAAAPGYQVAGASTAPPQCAIIGSTLAFPIVNPTTGQGGVAFVNTSTGAVTASTALANTTVSGCVTTDATNFYALFGGMADSTVVALNTSGVVQWTTALGSPGQPGVITYVANTTSLYVSNALNSWTLNTSGTITGGGVGINLIAIFDGGTIVPPAPSGFGTNTFIARNLLLVAISNGGAKIAKNGVWNSITGGASAFSGTPRVIRAAANQQHLYFLDANSYQYYDPVTNSIVAWVATQGSLPRDSGNNYARLICTWRGRTVLSGLPLDPQNWFMSAVNDPSNWNYLPQNVTPTQAVAGNSSPLGLVGRPVTALIPYTDDLLIFGLDNSIYLMRGDPMIGGQLDLVTNQVGMAPGEAFTMDPYGTVYFMSGRCAIYQYQPGSVPQRISQAIENLLQQIVLDDVIVSMAWDDQLQGVHVFVTHTQNARPETHFFWEHRTGGWFTDTFAKNEHNPFVAYTYFGSTPSDRVCLIGSWDGHVRAFQLGAANDEGVAINSTVVLGPLNAPELDDILLRDFQAVLGSNSGTVTYNVLVGQTAEQALMAPAVVTGTLNSMNGGRNVLSFVRRSGYAIYLKLTGTNPWSFEQVRLRVESQGKVRQRQVQI